MHIRSHLSSIYRSFSTTFSEVIYFSRKFIFIRKVGKVGEKWEAGKILVPLLL